MSFGERLKKAREQKGLTQVEASRLLGITNTALSNYEREERDPDTSLLKRLSELYGVSADLLLGITKTNELDLLSILEDEEITITLGKHHLSRQEREKLGQALSEMTVSDTDKSFSDIDTTEIDIHTGKPAGDNLYYSDIDNKLEKAVIVASHQGGQVMQQVSPALRQLIKQEIISILEENKSMTKKSKK